MKGDKNKAPKHQNSTRLFYGVSTEFNNSTQYLKGLYCLKCLSGNEDLPDFHFISAGIQGSPS